MLSKEQSVLITLVNVKLEEMSAKFSVSLADFDAVSTYIDADPTIFPERLKKLLASPGQNNDEWQLTLTRVRSIAGAMSQIPKSLNARGDEKTQEQVKLLPLFELEDAEKNRILELCGQMRKIVWASDDFDQPHRVRLLNRIAAIEIEVQKPKGWFDVVRGGIDDLGETPGSFGVKIKPLTDRMAEVVGIARRKTKDYEKLPTPEEVKQLPPPDGNG